MPTVSIRHFRPGPILAALSLLAISAVPAVAQVTPFKQAVAEAAARDDALAQFYRSVQFEGIWVDNDDRARRQAFLQAMESAGDHGLPPQRYDAARMTQALRAANDPVSRGRVEVEMSRLFLQYARDIQTGVLVPSRVDSGIVREVPYRSRVGTLTALVQSNPGAFIRSLAPAAPEYTRLMREKLRLERLIAQGGWGPTVPGTLKPGASGPAVVALRDRLVAKGFMNRSATSVYDDSVRAGVQRFQVAYGLNPDGVAGQGTVREINRAPEERLRNIIVAMERERWINRPRGTRHVWVNLTDFTAAIIDNDAETFKTRSVIGATQSDRRSPEFSDVMEFMVINPSWYVPRSIVTKEYLPMLKRNPYAVNHIQITDNRGRVVNRAAVDFNAYTEQTFPFAMREPPSQGNALGLVKFMFPNRYNIYLHDTPAKSLFGREVRAFSHGCIRLRDPFDFAYELLSKQTADPEGFFRERLRTGRETRVDMAQPVPVHIVYRTAFTDARGQMNYRRDVYGRDAKIWNALAREGVVIRALGG
ncbi:L,D-transpeptidase family protein [Aestuariibius sp. 2305UL40-4]|uniref:L,D-transpeptidase family protein n=1 Tax=Aestuariibius violaceus TaxID=3234132 RepID=UPI00345E6329